MRHGFGGKEIKPRASRLTGSKGSLGAFFYFPLSCRGLKIEKALGTFPHSMPTAERRLAGTCTHIRGEFQSPVGTMNLKRIFTAVGFFLFLLAGVWYVYFYQNISLPNKGEIRKIEVFQNDFRQHAQQLTYVEEPDRIGKIYDFIDKRKRGWQPLLYRSPVAVAYADFYSSRGLLFRLCLMNSSNFLIRNSDGAYLKSLRNEDRADFMGLLGLRNGSLVSAGPKPNSL